MITTLKAKWHVALFATFLYITAPLVEAVYYTIQQGRGTYPANADSIAIPIFQFAFGLLLLSPLYVVVLWLAVRSYRGGRPLLAFDMTRPMQSVFWTLLLGGLALYELGYAAYSAYRLLPSDVAASLLWVYLLLCLRSSLAGGRQQTERQPAL